MGALVKVKTGQLEAALTAYRGNIAAVARTFGVSRAAIYKRLGKSATLSAALHDARETMLDTAEGILHEKVLQGDTRALLFFLRTQGKARGYTTKQEVALEQRGPLVVRWNDGDEHGPGVED